MTADAKEAESETWLISNGLIYGNRHERGSIFQELV